LPVLDLNADKGVAAMKRDMELIREIPLATEGSSDPQSWVTLKLPGRTKKEVSYHVELLGDAGLIEAQDLRTIGPDGYEWQPRD